MKCCPSSHKLRVLLLALLSGAAAYLIVQRRTSVAGTDGPRAESPAPAPTEAPVVPATTVGRHLADVPAEEVSDDLGEGLPTGPVGPGNEK